ncbi:carboxypeptidase-like regulatory domain-containing protein [Salinimicrobium oceani]|uniref:Carboxypeptidase-like regulatory domain-containing protein n=1 Tax=Salinimicrobium oceani TaxID=2722702 RepID=A0ABX1CVD9_9FLAO|nr:carboxypeptidase-like regulatory domain-containing protein [Salinimicrobium oceani]NJW52265.1 carboxypeptidase-like regulatory domain-containing protein [Salinimicrobium oceani]
MRSFLFIFLFLQADFLQAQEIKAQVLDASTKKPIPYANVIFAENRGIVTNEEGFFGYIPEKENSPKRIKISSLGYELLEIAPNDISAGIVYLKPASIELREVFLSNKNLSAKEVIEKVKEEVKNNYNFDNSRKRIFLRESDFNYIRRFDLEVDKSTIAGIDQKLMNEISSKIPKVSDSYKEILADMYGNYDQQKVNIIKAANLYNPQNTKSLEQLTDHLSQLFMNTLKERSYLKVRSGIVGVKIDEDELQEEFIVKEQKKEKTSEEIEQDRIKSRENLQKGSNSRVKKLLNGMFWKEDIVFNLFDKSNKYRFKINGYAWIDNATVYVIDFEPKRGADFKGRMYVNTIDYGVHRLEYENVKPLKKFRLFGISTADDVYRGKMIFIKDEAGKYNLSYLERETGESVGIDRPLTIIEKNKHVPGRRKQNELDLDLRLNVSSVNKLQLVVYENESLTTGLAQINETSDFEYETFKAYNPDFWNGYNIIEPNAAIKSFVAFENDEESL